MFNSFIKFAVAVILSLVLIVPEAVSVTRKTAEKQRAKREKNKKTTIWVMPEIKLLLFPRLTVGVLTGDAGQLTDPKDDGITAKGFYGGGIGLEYWYKPSVIIGAGVDLLQKDLGHLNIDEAVKTTLISAEVAYRYPAGGKSSIILRFRGSNGSVSYDGTHVGNYFFKRFGVGVYSFGGSSNLVTVFEIYYQTASTEDATVKLPGLSFKVPVPLSSIGFEIGLGIPL